MRSLHSTWASVESLLTDGIHSFSRTETSLNAQVKETPLPGASLLPFSRGKRSFPGPDLHSCWSTVVTADMCAAQILGQASPYSLNFPATPKQVQSWSLFYKCVHGDSSKFRNCPTILQLVSGKAPLHIALESHLLHWAGNLHLSPFSGLNICPKGRELISFGHSGSLAPRLVQGAWWMFAEWTNEWMKDVLWVSDS